MLYTLFHNWSQSVCFSDLSLKSAQASEEFWFSQPVLLHVCMWTGTFYSILYILVVIGLEGVAVWSSCDQLVLRYDELEFLVLRNQMLV